LNRLAANALTKSLSSWAYEITIDIDNLRRQTIAMGCNGRPPLYSILPELQAFRTNYFSEKQFGD
jgi:hypothetical protein